MSERRRHHLVPEFYLRRFADEKDQIRVVSRDRQKQFVTSVEKAAAETDFHSVNTADGRSQEIEKMLGQIEGAAAPVIDRIVAGGLPLTAGDRESLAWFIAFQFNRGRDFRQVLRAMTEYMGKLLLVNMTEDKVRAVLAEQAQAPTEEEVAAALAMAADPEGYKVEPSQNMLVGMMLSTVPKLVPFIGGRRWQLVRYPGPVLLTSDAPVGVWTGKAPPAPFGVGLGNADVLTFPLDGQHVLLLLAPDLTEREGVHQQQDGRHAGLVNLITATRGFEWLYHHPGHDPLDGLELPPPGPRVKITGPPLERWRRESPPKP